MMACRDVARLRSAFLALELDRDTEARVRRHLDHCEECSTALAAEDPAAAFALRLGKVEVGEDATFVAEVLAGIHQRRIESGLMQRRRGLLAAAAGLVLAIVAGWAWLQGGGPAQPDAVAVRARPVPVTSRSAVAAVEPAFVEVEGEGVRLYQIDTPSKGAVRIAFIVDPQLEL